MGFMRVMLWNILPNSKRSLIYAVEDYCKKHIAHYREDLTTLLGWLKAGKIKPLIAETLPLEQAPQAQQMLLEAKVRGKILLLP